MLLCKDDVIVQVWLIAITINSDINGIPIHYILVGDYIYIYIYSHRILIAYLP